jgi:hypothetical protein
MNGEGAERERNEKDCKVKLDQTKMKIEATCDVVCAATRTHLNSLATECEQ